VTRVGHIDELPVIGTKRESHVDFCRPIGTNKLPFRSARQQLALEFGAFKGAAFHNLNQLEHQLPLQFRHNFLLACCV
jgi:hypothetical protein